MQIKVEKINAIKTQYDKEKKTVNIRFDRVSKGKPYDIVLVKLKKATAKKLLKQLLAELGYNG